MPAGVQPEQQLVRDAEELGATVLRTDAATIIVVPRKAPTADDLIPFPEAAQIARVSLRTLGEARRTGALPTFGGQRDRCVRRRDLEVWIESRRARPVAGADDDDLSRRFKRLAAKRRAA